MTPNMNLNSEDADDPDSLTTARKTAVPRGDGTLRRARRANSYREPSDDYPVGTMVDYQDRDVDSVTPRRQQAEATSRTHRTNRAETTTGTTTATVGVTTPPARPHEVAASRPTTASSKSKPTLH